MEGAVTQIVQSVRFNLPCGGNGGGDNLTPTFAPPKPCMHAARRDDANEEINPPKWCFLPRWAPRLRFRSVKRKFNHPSPSSLCFQGRSDFRILIESSFYGRRTKFPRSRRILRSSAIFMRGMIFILAALNRIKSPRVVRLVFFPFFHDSL